MSTSQTLLQPHQLVPSVGAILSMPHPLAHASWDAILVTRTLHPPFYERLAETFLSEAFLKGSLVSQKEITIDEGDICIISKIKKI